MQVCKDCAKSGAQYEATKTRKGFIFNVKNLGWAMGFEPTTLGATVRCSTAELRPPQTQIIARRRRSG